MMTESDIRQKSMEKAYRSQVRLRYSILADEEINRNITDVRESVKNAIARGRVVQFTLGEITIDGKSVEALVSGDNDTAA